MKSCEYIILILAGIVLILTFLCLGIDIKKSRHRQMCESNNIECCVSK
jgi:hypothetical protein